MVMQYWSANSLFWQLSINHNMDTQIKDIAMVMVVLSYFFQGINVWTDVPTYLQTYSVYLWTVTWQPNLFRSIGYQIF